MTSATSGTSIPLAATSVATSMSALPFLKRYIALSLLNWDISPWIDTTLKFAWVSSCATRLVLSFVEQKTIV